MKEMVTDYEPLAEDRPVGSERVWILGIMCASCYSLTYFWRYPLFVLPEHILAVRIVTVWGRDLSFQQCCSMAMMLGFFLAKFPALCVMTGQTFFRWRRWALLSLFWASMLIECVGVAVFVQSSPGISVIFVFMSSMLSSWLYGGVITYLEGRTRTDALLAVVSFFYIYAGPS